MDFPESQSPWHSDNGNENPGFGSPLSPAKTSSFLGVEGVGEGVVGALVGLGVGEDVGSGMAQ